MSVNQLKNEIHALISTSGMAPNMKMRCSILRTLKMRHGTLDTPLTRSIIENAIKDLS